MTTKTNGRLGWAAEAPLGLAEDLRGRATSRRKRPGSGQERGLGLLVPGKPELPWEPWTRAEHADFGLATAGIRGHTAPIFPVGGPRAPGVPG